MGESVAGRHSDDEYLDAVREHEPAATSEVADAVGVARQSADYRLRRLEAEGLVEREQIGNSLAWSAGEAAGEPHGIDPADAFWTAKPYDGPAMSVSDIDDVLSGNAE